MPQPASSSLPIRIISNTGAPPLNRHSASMAKSLASLLLNSPLSPPSSFSQSLHHLQAKTFPQSQSYSGVGTRTKPISASMVEAQPPVRKEDIIIVGAGIAGLATAVSLHRLGVGSLVLEQAESLRTGGTSLTLFKNGWGVLDAMGVGNDLRSQFLEIQGCAGWW